MKAELVDEMYSLIEAQVKPSPLPAEFEMAYPVRVAIDRIRFGIRNTDQFTQRPKQWQEASLQLLDAIDRLESAERRFRAKSPDGGSQNILQGPNGSTTASTHGGRQ